MVAGKEDEPGSGRSVSPQAFDNLLRGRAAIDQVAKEDQDAVRRAALPRILFDPAKQLRQQVITAVDISNRLKAVSGRKLGLAGQRRVAEQPGKRLHRSASR